jgi:hypothetical protein
VWAISIIKPLPEHNEVLPNFAEHEEDTRTTILKRPHRPAGIHTAVSGSAAGGPTERSLDAAHYRRRLRVR